MDNGNGSGNGNAYDALLPIEISVLAAGLDIPGEFPLRQPADWFIGLMMDGEHDAELLAAVLEDTREPLVLVNASETGDALILCCTILDTLESGKRRLVALGNAIFRKETAGEIRELIEQQKTALVVVGNPIGEKGKGGFITEWQAFTNSYTHLSLEEFAEKIRQYLEGNAAA